MEYWSVGPKPITPTLHVFNMAIKLRFIYKAT